MMYDDHVMYAIFTWIIRYKPSLTWIFAGNTRGLIIQQLKYHSGVHLPDSPSIDPYSVNNLMKWIEDNHD